MLIFENLVNPSIFHCIFYLFKPFANTSLMMTAFLEFIHLLDDFIAAP